MGSYWSYPDDENPSTMNQPTNQPKHLRNPSVTVLKEILRSIKLDENLIRENNQILRKFLETFVAAMKRCDTLFSTLYQEPYFTGSFYSDLRISKPDEFDINLIFSLPFKPQDFEVIYQLQVPSYAKYKLKNPTEWTTRHPELMRTFFEDGYLMHERVRVWMQRVVDKAKINYRPPADIVRMVNSASGPARTIKLMKYRGLIDIDLVPVVKCHLETTQPGIDGRVRCKFPSLQGFLVPKPYSSTGQLPVNQREVSYLWRTHFPEPEKKMLHDVGCSKPVIKLLKLLRDKEDWKILASYYMKTVVLWMIVENPSQEYWQENKMGDRFLEALKKLSKYVGEKKIPYIFSKKCNLISKMNDQQAVNIHSRLERIIRNIEADPLNLWEVFNVTPTF